MNVRVHVKNNFKAKEFPAVTLNIISDKFLLEEDGRINITDNFCYDIILDVIALTERIYSDLMRTEVKVYLG